MLRRASDFRLFLKLKTSSKGHFPADVDIASVELNRVKSKLHSSWTEWKCIEHLGKCVALYGGTERLLTRARKGFKSYLMLSRFVANFEKSIETRALYTENVYIVWWMMSQSAFFVSNARHFRSVSQREKHNYMNAIPWIFVYSFIYFLFHYWLEFWWRLNGGLLLCLTF